MSNTISVDGVTYLRPKLFRVLTVRIGVTAVWHSHRHTCSTARAGRFRRENKPCRRPANIPTCGTGSPVVYDGEDVTLVPFASFSVINRGFKPVDDLR